MADLPIKDLGEALQITNDALFVYTQPNGASNTTYKAPVTQLGGKLIEDMTFSNLTTTSKTVEGAINEVRGVILTDTLETGQISITFTDTSITTSSTIDIYTDADIDYNSITVATGSITIAFDAQSSDVGVKVRVF